MHHSRPYNCCLFSILLSYFVQSDHEMGITFSSVPSEKGLQFFDSLVWQVMQCKHQWEELEACTEMTYFPMFKYVLLLKFGPSVRTGFGKRMNTL